MTTHWKLEQRSPLHALGDYFHSIPECQNALCLLCDLCFVKTLRKKKAYKTRISKRAVFRFIARNPSIPREHYPSPLATQRFYPFSVWSTWIELVAQGNYFVLG